MEIKSYASLSEDERYAVRHFFEMFKGPTLSKNENDVHAYMTMMDLESGALFFTIWQDKQVIATLGVVLVALPTRSEAYLTGAALRNSNSAIEAMQRATALADDRGRAAQQVAEAAGRRYDSALAKIGQARAVTCAEAMPAVNSLLESLR